MTPDHDQLIRHVVDTGSPRSAGAIAATASNAESTIELLAKAKTGDRPAIDRLFERCLPPLRRWARGRLPQYARHLLDTDDLVQETAMRMLAHVESFEPRSEGALQAYLRQALANRIRDEIRVVARRPVASSLEPGAQHVDEQASPLEQAIGREALETYETALKRLRASDREAIVARIELQYSYQQLAEALGKPSVEAARMTVARALVRLASEMDHAG